jgi:hypothetical protein
MVLPAGKNRVRTWGPQRRAAWSRSALISATGLTLNLTPSFYTMEKVQRLWGHPTVAWTSRLSASLGGRYMGPS